MTRSRLHLLGTALVVVALVVAACGGSDSTTTSGATSGAAPAATTAPAGSTAAAAPDANVSGTVSMAGVWTGDEQKNFQAVLDGFKKQFPNVTVQYNPAGDQLPTVLATAVEGGKPPDVAAVAQPGLMRDFQAQGKLKPIDYAKDAIAADFGQSWIDLGTVDNHLYGLTFKAANKSTVWYNVPAFTDAGVQPPKTWDELLTDSRHAAVVRSARRTPSAVPTAGRSPTCSRTSTCARPGRTCTTSCPRTRSRGPTSPSRTRSRRWRRSSATRRTSPAARPARSRPTSRRR